MALNFEQEEIITSAVFKGRIGDLLSFDFHTIVDDFFGGFWGISRGLLLSILFAGLLGILWRLIPNLPLFAFEWVFGTLPIWLPVVSVIGGWKAWIWYTRASFIAGLDNMLLEVKFPRDIVKSPRAMEEVLTKLWTDSGETTFFNRVFQGQARPWFSLEMASFGGEVHFYIWCRREWREVVESAMYAQYPMAEITEVEDYTSFLPDKYPNDKYDVFGLEFGLSADDPYPIRMYEEFEYNITKDLTFNDPMASILENFTRIGKGENLWLHIIIEPTGDTWKKTGIELVKTIITQKKPAVKVNIIFRFLVI